MGEAQWDVLVKILNANKTVKTCPTIEFFLVKLRRISQTTRKPSAVFECINQSSETSKNVEIYHWAHISPAPGETQRDKEQHE